MKKHRKLKLISLFIIIMLLLQGCTKKDVEESASTSDERENSNIPIIYIKHAKIEPIGECEFVLTGNYIAEDNSRGETIYNYFEIYSIEIRAIDGDFRQVIGGSSSHLRTHISDYGFRFEDWNADGIMDFCLQQYEGGSLVNRPSLFWLWDEEQMKFVESEQLNEISQWGSVYMQANEDSRLQFYTRISSYEHVTEYYVYQDGLFVLDEVMHICFEEENGVSCKVTRIYRIIDGEMQIIEEIREVIE
jgi:hypothetical protein